MITRGARDSTLVVLAALEARNLVAVLDDVCRRRGVVRHEICGRTRTQNVCVARQELWWRIRNDPDRNYSLTEIAMLFQRNHATVRQGIGAHEMRAKA